MAQRILGADWRGCLVTDFYAAYNLIPGRHQRCWTHLLRDLHEFKQEQAGNAEEVQRQADRAYVLWQINPHGHGLHFKLAGKQQPV